MRGASVVGRSGTCRSAPSAATALRASSRVVNTLVLRPADQMTMVDADERDRPSRGIRRRNY